MKSADPKGLHDTTESQAQAVSPGEYDDQDQGEEDLTTALHRSRIADREKGKTIVKQMQLWDSIIDARIKLQKALNLVPNPSPEVTIPQNLSTVLQAGLDLSNDLFRLQEARAGAEGISPCRKRRKLHDSSARISPQTLAEDLTCATEAFANLEASFHPQQVQTLQKWSAKVQSGTPSALLPSNERASFHQGDPQVFDDTDFYQEVLRDVIRAKSTNLNADESEAMQRKKVNKAVDTKASKGRKLRYEIHEKLQNFMVPVPVRGTWHDEQIDQLFASFMGKRTLSGDAPATAAVALDGLRAF